MHFDCECSDYSNINYKVNKDLVKSISNEYGYDVDIVKEIKSPRFITYYVQFLRHTKLSEILRQKEDLAFSLGAAKVMEMDAVSNS